MKHVINRTNRFLRIAAILLCGLIVLGMAPPWITAWSFGLYLRAAGACNYYTLDRSIAPLG